MKVIVDRIEKDCLVLETEVGTTLNVPKKLIPEAKEGDIIKIEIDKNETENRKKEITDLMNQIFEEIKGD